MLAYTNRILYFCVDKSNVIMKMKRRFLSIVFGMLFFMPLEIIADPGDDWKGGSDPPHFIPPLQLALVSYNEIGDELTVTFRRAVDNAYLYIYKDCSLIETDWLVGTVAGDSYIYYTEGSGTYTVVLQIGETLITLYDEIIE